MVLHPTSTTISSGPVYIYPFHLIYLCIHCANFYNVDSYNLKKEKVLIWLKNHENKRKSEINETTMNDGKYAVLLSYHFVKCPVPCVIIRY